MNVAAILNQKGRAVTTARPMMTLMEVAKHRVAEVVMEATAMREYITHS